MPSPFSDTFHLDKIASITLTDARSSVASMKVSSTYTAGLLRREVSDMTLTVAGRSTGSRFSSTYSYSADGRLGAVDQTWDSTRSGVTTSQQVYEYDQHGRLTRVGGNEGAGTPFVTLATCAYGASTIVEEVAASGGLRAKSFEYTLDTEGRVTRYSLTLEGREDETDVTTITYRDGKIVREENRIEDTIYPIKVTVTDYNDAGLPVKEVETTYDKHMKLNYQSTRTFEYVMDASDNWVQRREYEERGDTKELAATAARVIVYVNK
ncbi:hypothetical protein DAERI_130077 [Deinococcus aerius]|uniref:YD repeat-containing protein n=1 Tax=Deinococcus aerius TaxID=200253 RepID=A0A2I9DW92_9DEIO|nr:hypothetical protein DAERI_130077 [Deinococcus aerius]